jgi:hypothetical protein
MLSGKLIHLIESHGEEITVGVISSIRRQPELSHFGKLPDWELRQRGHEILQNLGHWLASGNEEKLAHEYEAIGKIRFEESVPLSESVRGLCLIKDKMIEFLDNQGIDQDALALYAEEQLERKVGRFFDVLVVHLVKGYETAWRQEQMAAAQAG